MSFDAHDQPIDWQELDRLVDGQLTDDEYRELIAEIDMHPGGWRQCALAFLEHQAMQSELTKIGQERNESHVPLPVNLDETSLPSLQTEEQAAKHSVLEPIRVASVDRKQSSGAAIAWFSMAICILVGLAFGLAMQSEFRERLQPHRTITVSKPQPNDMGFTPPATQDQDVIEPEANDYRKGPLYSKHKGFMSRSSPRYNQRIHQDIGDSSWKKNKR